MASMVMASIAACSPATPESGRTVQDYVADASLRNATVQRCANDPGRLKDTPDCLNAQAAARIEGVGSLRNLPLLPLPPPVREATPASPPSDSESVNTL
ncbi:MAG: EexN family lipoprotein [Steroidobacteraceae bacterium]